MAHTHATATRPEHSGATQNAFALAAATRTARRLPQGTLGVSHIVGNRAASGILQRTKTGSGTTGTIVQRKCSACAAGGAPCAHCAEESEEESQQLQRSPAVVAPAAGSAIPAAVQQTLSTPGEPLPDAARAEMEHRFDHDFSDVRVHADAVAATSARDIGALAYTAGSRVVFGAAQYAPNTSRGLSLLAHELAHVIQQRGGGLGGSSPAGVVDPDAAAEREAARAERTVHDHHPLRVRERGPVRLARAPAPRTEEPWTPAKGLPATPGAPSTGPCLAATECKGPVAGSAQEFGQKTVAAEEAHGRDLGLSQKTPAQARAIGHGAVATQMERFMARELPDLRQKVAGVIVDLRQVGVSSINSCTDINASVKQTADPLVACTNKQYIFVTKEAEDHAAEYNAGKLTIGGTYARDVWRARAVTMFAHEVGHTTFHTFGIRDASAKCPRSSVETELSELTAILSEFPQMVNAVPAGPPSVADPMQKELATWFDEAITNPSESISGTLKKMRCTCSCFDVDTYVIDIFMHVSASWKPGLRDMFNREMHDPKWAKSDLRWPLQPGV